MDTRPTTRLAPDGYPTIALLSCVLAVCAACGLAPSGWAWRIASAVAVLPLAMSLWFYRDPERAPAGEGWLSPADGVVVEVIEGARDDYAGETTKVGIFMSGFDVHVNRSPDDGVVEYTRYVPGKKWFAIAPKASEENERFYVGIRTTRGRATLVQIAGIMARRIAPRVRIGDGLARGARYGMIKLGSKVDLYLPAGLVPAVSEGDRVLAGETVIAR